MGSRRIHNDPAGHKPVGKCFDQIIVGGMDHSRVAHPAVFHHLFAALDSFRRIIYNVIGQDGAQLFPGQGVFRTHPLQSCYQNFGSIRHCEAGHLGN